MIADENFLTDDRISQAISDATNDLPSYANSDGRAVRYKACELLARRFKMQSVTRSGDKTYSEIDVQVYTDMVHERLRRLSGGRAVKINYQDANVDNGVEY